MALCLERTHAEFPRQCEGGLPCKFLARSAHLHVSWCPQGTWQLYRNSFATEPYKLL
jgi:hypothetical protein